MAIPIRFAPVLEGDEAWEFLERVKSLENVPDPAYSEEKRKEWKEFFRKQKLRELNEEFAH